METKKTLLKLSFSGSKINRIREIEQLIENKKYKRVVEVFGGSCCISNNLKRDNIIQEAIANDYDHYFDRFYKNIEYKEGLITKLKELGFEKSADKRALSKDKQRVLQELIADIQDNKSLIYYLSKNFVFSARRSAGIINIADFCYFMNELSTHHDREYYKELKKIQLDSLDYKNFIKKYIQPNDRDTLIILDPPYLNSNQKQYNNDIFFGLCETIRLLNIMKFYFL